MLLLWISPDSQSKEYLDIVFWDGLVDFQQLLNFRDKAHEKGGEVKKALLELKELKNTGYADSALLYDVVAQQQ